MALGTDSVEGEDGIQSGDLGTATLMLVIDGEGSGAAGTPPIVPKWKGAHGVGEV